MAWRLNQTFIVHFLNRNRCNRDAISIACTVRNGFTSTIASFKNLLHSIHTSLLAQFHSNSYRSLLFHLASINANCSYEQHVNLSLYESCSFSLNKRSFVCFACLSSLFTLFWNNFPILVGNKIISLDFKFAEISTTIKINNALTCLWTKRNKYKQENTNCIIEYSL